jgi:hypothetical protein
MSRRQYVCLSNMKHCDMNLFRYKSVTMRRRIFHNGIFQRVLIRNVILRKKLGVVKNVPVVNLFP